MLLIRHLQRQPDHVRPSFGTLNVSGPVGLADFLTIYKAFHKAMSRRFGKCVQYRPFTEVGPRCGRLHLHYAMTGDGVEVTKADVLNIWRAACGGRRVQVDHEPMFDVVDCVRYLFKADAKYHDSGNPECVVLFGRGTHRLPQATQGFFPGRMKKALWEEWKASGPRHRRGS